MLTPPADSEVTRPAVLDLLSARLFCLARGSTRPFRVAIDGIDASGKTTLAAELEERLAALGLPVVRASLDGFHRPRQERYRQGPASPAGYYFDSFDYTNLHAGLLDPLGPRGDRRIQRAAYDCRSDSPAQANWEAVPQDSVLLLDGVFLLRPKLNPSWDYRIFVEIPFATAVERALVRDISQLGSAENVRRRYAQRYLPGQQLYLDSVNPQALAQALLQNEDPTHPRLIFQEH